MIELCKLNECTGCSACVNICPKHCIQMTEDREGFFHPTIDSSMCIECHACQRVCPVLNPLEKYDLPLVYAAFNNDQRVRAQSSSGGMFNALATQVIEIGGKVAGALFKENLTLVHALTDSMTDVQKMMGSKYLQSHIPGSLYKDILSTLKDGHKVLFTGTPCQVAGCRKFIPTSLQDHILFVDIICHGVPSQSLFNDYIEKLSKKIGKHICAFNFRTRDGWGIAPAVSGGDNSWHELSGSENIYMTLFLQSYTFRDNCYKCQYATPQRISDITIADFWGLGDDTSYEHDKTLGVSLLLINSPKGKHAIDRISDNLTLDKRSLHEAAEININLSMPSHRPRQRQNIYRYFFAHSLEDTYTHYFNNPYRKIRRTVGKIIRKIGKR